MTLQMVIVSFLAGIALGLRYKIVMLTCGIAFVLMFATMVGLANRDSILSIVLAMAIAATAIQIGYLAVIWIRAADTTRPSDVDRLPWATIACRRFVKLFALICPASSSGSRAVRSYALREYSTSSSGRGRCPAAGRHLMPQHR
jgi:hypothetical protein